MITDAVTAITLATAVVAILISLSSMLISLSSLRVAKRAEKRAFERESKLGRLESVTACFVGPGFYELQIVNGPVDVVIDALHLTVSYVEPFNSNWYRGPTTVMIIEPESLELFGLVNPGLPRALPANSSIKFRIPEPWSREPHAVVKSEWTVSTGHEPNAGSATYVAGRSKDLFYPEVLPRLLVAIYWRATLLRMKLGMVLGRPFAFPPGKSIADLKTHLKFGLPEPVQEWLRPILAGSLISSLKDYVPPSPPTTEWLPSNTRRKANDADSTESSG